MGFSTCQQEAPIEHDRAVIKCRRLTARLLGQLFVRYDEQLTTDVLTYLTQHLNYRSAIHRIVIGMIASEWAKVNFRTSTFKYSVFLLVEHA